MFFILPPLPYAYNALEPYIDARTMEIHYTKHHQTYVDNLNKALEDCPKYQKWSLEELIKNVKKLPKKIQTKIRNNAGGHYNHSLFWRIMSPNGGGLPKEKVLAAIERDFGGFEQFKKQFSELAKNNFGSGWTWLCSDNKGVLSICSTPNQDTPLTDTVLPILGLDTWEHAYYLKYQNRRAEYIEAWWNVVNWDEIEKNYTATH